MMTILSPFIKVADHPNTRSPARASPRSSSRSLHAVLHAALHAPLHAFPAKPC